MSKKVIWTPEMIAFLREHYLDMTNLEIGSRLFISETTVRHKCNALGLVRPKRQMSTVWTDEMLSYLREHFADDTAGDIGDVVGVSSTTVIQKARELGLKKSESFDKMRYKDRYTSRYRTYQERRSS